MLQSDSALLQEPCFGFEGYVEVCKSIEWDLPKSWTFPLVEVGFLYLIDGLVGI